MVHLPFCPPTATAAWMTAHPTAERERARALAEAMDSYASIVGLRLRGSSGSGMRSAVPR